jgi:hypothetical protein
MCHAEIPLPFAVGQWQLAHCSDYLFHIAGFRASSPPVHMIKLTKEREIAPYVWVHPDDDR